MTLPWIDAIAFDEDELAHVRRRMIFDCCKWDPQTQDQCTLSRAPLVLRASAWYEIAATAELLYRETIAAERELATRPDLARRLALPRRLRRALRPGQYESSGPRAMRFDFHPTPDGWRVSEVNSDVPGGYVEAAGFSALACSLRSGVVTPGDPADALAFAIYRRAGSGANIALVHATAFSDDAQVVRFLATRMRRLGLRTLEIGPTQVVRSGDRLEALAGGRCQRIDAIFRFFPAEWLANLPREAAHPFFSTPGVPHTNPPSSLLSQSKRLPLVWDRLSVPMSTWRRFLPLTVDPRDGRPRDGWVWKPALGRVGEGVGIEGVTPPRLLSRIRIAAKLRPRAWVVQRRFQIVPWTTAAGTLYPSVGVFVVDGKAAGAYGRAASVPIIDAKAVDVAVLVEDAAIRVAGAGR